MKKNIEAYQPFFFSGLLFSILGLGLWVLFQEGIISFYPMENHAFVMVMSFLFAYINGFLMTAVPKMAQAQEAQSWEVRTGVFLFWLQIPFVLLGYFRLNCAIAFLQISFLTFFIGKRFFYRKANPPKAFVFLPFGLAAAAFGTLILSLDPEMISTPVRLLAKNFLFQAFALNLILGLGSRLVPSLTRVQGALDVRSFQKERIWTYLIPAIVLNMAFVFEAFWLPVGGEFLKFAVVLWMSYHHLKITKPLQVQGFLGIGIRLSVASLGLGFLLAGLFPLYAIHFLHFSFIGGFALITFLISTRVVLAHGGYNLAAELNEKRLGWFFTLALLIGALRVVMGFEGQFRNLLIWFLFGSWVLLCGIWSSAFLRKLLKQSPL